MSNNTIDLEFMTRIITPTKTQRESILFCFQHPEQISYPMTFHLEESDSDQTFVSTRDTMNRAFPHYFLTTRAYADLIFESGKDPELRFSLKDKKTGNILVQDLHGTITWDPAFRYPILTGKTTVAPKNTNNSGIHANLIYSWSIVLNQIPDDLNSDYKQVFETNEETN